MQFSAGRVRLSEAACCASTARFRYGGRYTSESNATFDRYLRNRDPQSGIRDFEALDELARQQGLALTADHAMPANNQLLVWKSHAAAASPR